MCLRKVRSKKRESTWIPRFVFMFSYSFYFLTKLFVCAENCYSECIEVLVLTQNVLLCFFRVHINLIVLLLKLEQVNASVQCFTFN